MLSDKSRKNLLAIARQTLTDYFKTGIKLTLSEKDICDDDLNVKTATFVTITKQGQLRGCVGSLLAKKKMYEDVINNTLLAGFADSRFTPLKEDELKDIKIEISILSKIKPYIYNSLDELKNKIIPYKHGVIIQKEFSQATFLPQVWEDIPVLEDFMQALCRKAGLNENEWKGSEIEIFYYTVDKIFE